MLKPPLILTTRIDEKSFQYFNVLRQKHFPADRNYLDAHLTLFHALPNEHTIINFVKATAQLHAPFILTVTQPVFLGRGVAFKIESKELMRLHKSFQKEWLQFLTPQDKQTLWPHITVQNKVTASEAQTLLATLKAGFVPSTAVATGLQLWEYLDGPWNLLGSFDFAEVE